MALGGTLDVVRCVGWASTAMMSDPTTPPIVRLDPFGSDSDGHLVNEVWNDALEELTPRRTKHTLTEWRAAHGGSGFAVTLFGAVRES